MPTPQVDQAIAALLAEREAFTSGDLAARTGLTRQALHRHLVRAVRAGLLVREGGGRSTRYRPARSAGFDRSYPTGGLSEDRVADELDAWLDGIGRSRTPAADAVLAYAVTELVNNAIDHSGAAAVRVRADVAGAAGAAERLRLRIDDEGVGAFENVRAGLGLADHLHALQELSKGKTTTQPDRHTGEGLFFTSKMVDRFELTANGLTWVVDNRLSDQTVRAADPRPGTEVELEVALATEVRPAEIFDRYTHALDFDTTRCVVRLFETGATFVSRSEAKRLLANLERFREVLLDFHGVEAVGQGFVDEVFRVWARAHPEVRLVPTEMAPTVEFMVRRGLPRRGGGEAPRYPGAPES